MMNKTEILKNYSKTNQAFIEVETLGQIIALTRGNY